MHKEEFLYDLSEEVRRNLRHRRLMYSLDEEKLILRFSFPCLQYSRVELLYQDDETILKSVKANTEGVGYFNQAIAAEALAVAEVLYIIGQDNEIEAGSINYNFCKEVSDEVDYLRKQLKIKKEKWENRLSELFDIFTRDYAQNAAANYRSAIFLIVKKLPLCLVCRHITDQQSFERINQERNGACNAVMNIFMKMKY